MGRTGNVPKVWWPGFHLGFMLVAVVWPHCLFSRDMHGKGKMNTYALTLFVLKQNRKVVVSASA